MHQSGAIEKKNLNFIIGRVVLKPKLFTGKIKMMIKMYLVWIVRMLMKVVNLSKNQMIVID